jgi:hypothetical protein
MAALFLNQRTLEDRPRIKPCVIRPPQTPTVFMLFLNWKVNQYVISAFLPPPAKLVTPQALRRRTFGAASRLRLGR